MGENTAKPLYLDELAHGSVEQPLEAVLEAKADRSVSAITRAVK